MKQYRLSAWPDLPAVFRRTGYQRALHVMSQRFVGIDRLVSDTGLSHGELSRFVDLLVLRGAAIERGEAEPDSLFGALQELVGLKRRADKPQHRF
jgi:hypothetical protein